MRTFFDFFGGRKMTVVIFGLILTLWFVLIYSYVIKDWEFARFYIPVDIGAMLAFFGINGYLHKQRLNNGNGKK